MSDSDPWLVHDARVAVYRQEQPRYPAVPPFHPGESYPEAPFADLATDQPNEAYGGIRRLFALLGFDAANYGSARWNPLGRLIRHGDHVVLKPNFIRHVADPGGHWESLT